MIAKFLLCLCFEGNKKLLVGGGKKSEYQIMFVNTYFFLLFGNEWKIDINFELPIKP
jgi:hypothetical protein